MSIDPDYQPLRETQPPPGLAERLSAKLPSATAPARPLPSLPLRALVTLSLVALAMVGWGFSKGGRGWKALELEQQLSLVVLLVIPAALLAWDLAARMSPAPRLFWGPSRLVLPLLTAAVAWTIWATPYEGGPLLFYLPCLAFTTVGTAIGGGLLWFWQRKGYAWQRSAMPWALGSALVGFGAVELFCPYVEAAHILTSHVFPSAVVVVILHWVMRGKAAE
jgi:hypothetical protein